MGLVVVFVLGFAFGWWRAKRRGGNRLDQLQYGAGHGIALTLAALALGILLGHLGAG